jgi:uncharacterized membrane protein YhaH (DUF805 family)
MTDANPTPPPAAAPSPALPQSATYSGPVSTTNPPAQRFALLNGRLNRKFYWMVVAILIGAGIGLSFIPVIDKIVGWPLTIAWITIFGRRLHDFDRSAWWLLLIIVPVFASVIFMAATGAQMEMALGVGGLMQLLGTAILGAIPGSPGENRFGPPQGQQPTAEVFR